MGNIQQNHQLDSDLSLNDYRYLMKQTHLTPHVIQGWYREFQQICPNGQLTKNQFIKFYKQLENSATKNVESIAENVFQAFDHNGNQRIDFKEFLVAYALTSIGEPAEKLEYTFSLFDRDNSQTIEPLEMIDILKKLFTITQTKISDCSAECIAYDIFRTLDLDQNQSLSREEFINGCLKNKAIRCVLSPFESTYPSKD
uniref:Neuronal calcium sensor family member 2-like protein n=1 Tax=Philodina roseola TaxID=96448 RepID=B6S320_PHIRO|nr:neuronal calcium sensor family member 2-like protein [Philodina roseola]